MRVILLGAGSERLEPFLLSQGERTFVFEGPIESMGQFFPEDWVVSYGYRHILKDTFTRYFQRRPINLHISLLPWNRGADPNLWSFLENTPRGVSIHEIDAGLDTGPLLLQKEVEFQEGETLKSSYEKLQSAVEQLFSENWQKLRDGLVPAQPQSGKGSYHRSSDKAQFASLFSKGWDTPISQFIGKALR